MPLKSLLAAYAAQSGRYDELLGEARHPRAHWDAFLHALASRGAGSLGDTLALTEREVRENGITYNVYADPQGMDRPWQVDPLPLLLPAQEWRAIEEGIAQRAELLNRVLADVYGEQELLRTGAIPPAAVFGHAGFQLLDVARQGGRLQDALGRWIAPHQPQHRLGGVGHHDDVGRSLGFEAVKHGRIVRAASRRRCQPLANPSQPETGASTTCRRGRTRCSNSSGRSGRAKR